MAISETSICNMALSRIGSKRINNIDDSSVEAVHCRTQYDISRNNLLRAHPWRFSLARAVLSQDATDPAFGWEYAYALPNGCLRVLSIDGDPAFEVEGRKLMTDQDSAQIVYVKEITDPTQFDSMFVNLLALEIAVQLVMPMSQDKQLRTMLVNERDQAMARAMMVNLTEKRANRSPTWNESRRISNGGV